MQNQNQTKAKSELNILGWIFLLPVTLSVTIAGNLLLFLILTWIGFRNQMFLDSVTAFAGSFLFVFSASFFAPSKNTKVAKVLFGIIVFLAILSFILAVLGIDVFVERVMPSRLSIPVLQILGALYAAFLIPPLTTRGTILEQLWREIIALGTTVIIFGGILFIVGLMIGIITQTWTTLFIGISILCMGLVTELFPYVHLILRIQKFNMMSPKEIRRDMLAGLISRDNVHNGYYEKLGIQDKMNSVYDSNLYALESFIKKANLADELIRKYKLEGKDLNNEIAFNELKTNVDLIFKPKGIFSFFK